MYYNFKKLLENKDSKAIKFDRLDSMWDFCSRCKEEHLGSWEYSVSDMGNYFNSGHVFALFTKYGFQCTSKDERKCEEILHVKDLVISKEEYSKMKNELTEYQEELKKKVQQNITWVLGCDFLGEKRGTEIIVLKEGYNYCNKTEYLIKGKYGKIEFDPYNQELPKVKYEDFYKDPYVDIKNKDTVRLAPRYFRDDFIELSVNKTKGSIPYKIKDSKLIINSNYCYDIDSSEITTHLQRNFWNNYYNVTINDESISYKKMNKNLAMLLYKLKSKINYSNTSLMFLEIEVIEDKYIIVEFSGHETGGSSTKWEHLRSPYTNSIKEITGGKVEPLSHSCASRNKYTIGFGRDFYRFKIYL